MIPDEGHGSENLKLRTNEVEQRLMAKRGRTHPEIPNETRNRLAGPGIGKYSNKERAQFCSRELCSSIGMRLKLTQTLHLRERGAVVELRVPHCRAKGGP
jgi:hypothetical protein